MVCGVGALGGWGGGGGDFDVLFENISILVGIHSAFVMS